MNEESLTSPADPTPQSNATNAALNGTTLRVWEARTGTATAPRFLAFSESTATDLHFFAADIAGSIAHVAGLAVSGLVSQDEALDLIAELQALAHAHVTGNFVLDPELEDVHMNIEAKVTKNLGPVGAKLHTGRSRNDQVATCLVLYARKGLAQIASAAKETAAALQEQAVEHVHTPWVARTHGQPAQPATLGFLLAAHAFRFQAVADEALHVFDAIGESPLGAGAVAGSTLPLQPAATAQLLGLRPLRNALLATGTRDVVVQATAVAARAGAVAASLAEDLFQSTRDGAFSSPAPYTSGSSLMPQKRNPDALELVRGKGKALLGAHVQAQQVVAGLPLGYHRDFQETKPPLVTAMTDAAASLQVLAAVITGGSFHGDDWTDDPGLSGITATDVAEALVANGIPFRTAYTAVAQATQARFEGGVPFADALAAQGLPASCIQAAVAATTPDPARRASLGGPAPEQVTRQLDALATELSRIDAAVHAAISAAAMPFQWIEADPKTVLAHLEVDA